MLIDGAIAPFNLFDLAASFFKLSNLLSNLLSIHYSLLSHTDRLNIASLAYAVHITIIKRKGARGPRWLCRLSDDGIDVVLSDVALNVVVWLAVEHHH